MIGTDISNRANAQVQRCKSLAYGILANLPDMEIESDKELIEALIEYAGKTASVIAAEVGVSPSTLTRPLNHDVNYQLSKRTIDKLRAHFPNFPGFSSAAVIRNVVEVEMIRQVDISYAMGDGSIVEDYPETGMMPFDRNFLSMLGARTTTNLFICRGEGDSMSPTIFDNDLVMVDASIQRITLHDKIWALTVAGAGMIKRLRPLPNGQVMVLSDNPLIPEQVYEADDVYIVGKVIWIGRRM